LVVQQRGRHFPNPTSAEPVGCRHAMDKKSGSQ
jgi:hypothetical protein